MEKYSEMSRGTASCPEKKNWISSMQTLRHRDLPWICPVVNPEQISLIFPWE